MALTNKDVMPADVQETTVPKGASKTKGVDELANQGTAIISGMTDEQKEALGAKSGTLHFVHLLGLQSRKAERVVAGRQTIETFTPVGVTLVCDEAISVPQIDITKDANTGIDPADVTYKEVPAGEEINLSYYEFMYLIVRDEYSGRFEVNGDPVGAYLAVKTPKFLEGKAKLPTPTICFRGTGSPKETMIAIDAKGADDKWEIKPEYAEKFGALLKRKTVTRTGVKGGNKNSIPKPVVVSQALKKILGV